MNDERRRNIAVGLTALTGVTGLLVLLFVFGYFPRMFETGYTVAIHYPHASGLHEGSRVHLNGIDVGYVRSIQLESSPRHGVVVQAWIDDPNVSLPVDIVASVDAPILGGAATVSFVVDNPEQFAGGILPRDGTAQVPGEVGTIASQFSKELKSAIAGPTSQFTELTGAIKDLAAQWEVVGENLQAISDPRSPDQVDAGEAPGNLATVLARADTRLAEMETAIANLNAWVGDEQLRADFKAAVANTRQASGQLVTLTDDLSEMTTSIKSLVDAASTSDGTLGKLIHDPALYENLNDSAERFGLMLDDTRLLIQKWKAEGLPVQF